jgi:amino acid transporter
MEERKSWPSRTEPLLHYRELSAINVAGSSAAAAARGGGGVTAFGLVAVGFFWVSGGSYGNEALVLSAPPGVLLLGISAVGLCYGIPLALITAELGTGWPVAGGMAQWVEIACGEVVGAHNAWWIWVSYVFDSAIYPVLASHYVSQVADITWLEQKLYASFIVVIMTLIKLLGREVLERLSSLLALLTLIPSWIYIIASLKDLNLQYLSSYRDDPCTRLGTEAMCTAPNASSCRWVEDPALGAPEHHHSSDSSFSGLLEDDSDSDFGCEGMDLSLLISFIMWLYAGFLSLGSLAGELDDPQGSYNTALLILVPLVLLVNCFPLMVSMSLDHNRNNFQPGHFQTLAVQVCGEWMSIVYFIGSQVSLCVCCLVLTASCRLSC